ncbi:MAG TPA: hypothetical protein VG964_00825 [Candidatus Saccharimonadales bacterium]|nr:hypothetical protein [Candidatus Saccharimonadales bacterium]
MGVYQFCVSGAAKGESVEQGRMLAERMGAAIAKGGHSLLTGATTGLPNYAAIGYKKAGGKMSVGLSPAGSKVEHVLKYRLPTEDYDTIIYTGLHYVGRDTLLITSSDAVISIGGRLGTLHEFTISMETETPIGFLQGAGGISEEIQRIMDLAKPLSRGSEMIFSHDPTELVTKMTKFLDAEHAKYKQLY